MSKYSWAVSKRGRNYLERDQASGKINAQLSAPGYLRDRTQSERPSKRETNAALGQGKSGKVQLERMR